MYPPSHLGGFSDVFSEVLQTGAEIFKNSRMPAYADPSLRLPTTPPFIDPRTGRYLPQNTLSNYTVPLIIGGAVLLLALMRRGKT